MEAITNVMYTAYNHIYSYLPKSEYSCYVDKDGLYAKSVFKIDGYKINVLVVIKDKIYEMDKLKLDFSIFSIILNSEYHKDVYLRKAVTFNDISELTEDVIDDACKNLLYEINVKSDVIMRDIKIKKIKNRLYEHQ